MKKPHKTRITDAKVIEALRKTGGVIAAAAKSLGYASRSGLWERIQRTPALLAAHEDTRETNIDIVESNLMRKVQAGDTTAMIFYLKCQGKKRGWVDSPKLEEMMPAMTASLTINVVPDERSKEAD